MTNDERMRAFEMRLEGRTWADISRELGYTISGIQSDLLGAVQAGPRQPSIIYPAIRRYVLDHYGGVVRKFALDLGISYNTLYPALSGRRRINLCLEDAICQKMGVPPEVAFREESP